MGFLSFEVRAEKSLGFRGQSTREETVAQKGNSKICRGSPLSIQVNTNQFMQMRKLPMARERAV